MAFSANHGTLDSWGAMPTQGAKDSYGSSWDGGNNFTLGGSSGGPPSGPLHVMNGYAKGGMVKSCSYAEGGAVLGRSRSFMKEPDAFRSDTGPGAKQDYAGGKPQGADKCLKTVTPRA
jgi:hypothetical protein